MKKSPAGLYNPAELEELSEWHRDAIRCYVTDYSTEAVLHRVRDGFAATVPAYNLLRMVADRYSEKGKMSSNQEWQRSLIEIGEYASDRVLQNDIQFFEQLVVILRARKEGRKLNSLSRKALGIKVGRGRAGQLSNYETSVPLALFLVTQRRSREHAMKGNYTERKISRSELSRAIRTAQKKLGVEIKEAISEEELSRQITRFAFGKFMHE